VFQYSASREDHICGFRSVNDFLFFSFGKARYYDCHGEVWTDEDTNILRISENFEMSGAWKDLQSVANYGWLRRDGDAPRLIPVSYATQVQYYKRLHWCRGVFTAYRRFDVRSRLVANDAPSSPVSRTN
jgi:hypothetical protein